MSIYRRTLDTQVNALGNDEVEVIISTANLVEQDGLMLLPAGCDVSAYMRNPVVLFSHNPMLIVGRATQIVASADDIRARVQFATGISPIPSVRATTPEPPGSIPNGTFVFYAGHRFTIQTKKSDAKHPPPCGGATVAAFRSSPPGMACGGSLQQIVARVRAM